MTQLYFCEVYRLHGLPTSIVSDGDTRFLSHFYRILWKLFNTSLNFSSAYHSKTDGQTEVVNHSPGDLLRCLIGEYLKSWDQKLPQAEFTHNNAVNQSTDRSPFEVVYRFHPRGPLDLISLPANTKIQDKVEDFISQVFDVHRQATHNSREATQNCNIGCMLASE